MIRSGYVGHNALPAFADLVQPHPHVPIPHLKNVKKYELQKNNIRDWSLCTHESTKKKLLLQKNLLRVKKSLIVLHSEKPFSLLSVSIIWDVYIVFQTFSWLQKKILLGPQKKSWETKKQLLNSLLLHVLLAKQSANTFE